MQPQARNPRRCGLEPDPWSLGDQPARPIWALGAVLGDLADLRNDSSWIGLPASAVGAPHPRFRIFILAGRAVPIPFASDPARGGEILDQVKARRGTMALSHRVIDLVTRRGRQPSAETLFALIEEFFDAGDATPKLSPDGNESPAGRSAPAPAILNQDAGPRAAPAFVEWLMGLDQGVTDPSMGLSHAQQLTALGNGVLPRQAAQALAELVPLTTRRHLLPRP
jgi:DNA (cytosine-5)-methyltransferase 1